MQPTENAFDRVKSLLGKMDRSIDDARRRRLHEPDDDPDTPSRDQSQTNTNHSSQKSSHESTNAAGTNMMPEQPVAPDRPTSKYGRARPLNTLHSANGSDRQTA